MGCFFFRRPLTASHSTLLAASVSSTERSPPSLVSLCLVLQGGDTTTLTVFCTGHPFTALQFHCTGRDAPGWPQGTGESPDSRLTLVPGGGDTQPSGVQDLARFFFREWELLGSGT